MANKEIHKPTEFGVTFESLGSHCILYKVIALRITNPETYIANLHSFMIKYKWRIRIALVQGTALERSTWPWLMDATVRYRAVRVVVRTPITAPARKWP